MTQETENKLQSEQESTTEETENSEKLNDKRELLQFLRENKPSKEIKERSEEEVGLIEPLAIKVRDYKEKLKDSGAKEESINKLAVEYAIELKKSQQDPRPYIELGNRTYAVGRLFEEINKVIPENREVNDNDLERIYRLDHDLDEFKTVNDYYGHAAGDEILKTYSSILKGGEAVTWLKNLEVLDDRDTNNEMDSFEVTVEGGEEFGGMMVFKENFEQIQLEDGSELSSREEVVKAFIVRIQEEANRKFREVLTRKNQDGTPEFPIKAKLPNGVSLPEGFVIDSGSSFGYASFNEAMDHTSISKDELLQNNAYDVILQKIRASLFEVSDARAYQNKNDRKIARETSEEENKRITAEISPRGRAEMLERQARESSSELESKRNQLESANKLIATLTENVNNLKTMIETIKGTDSYVLIAPNLIKQVEDMESEIERHRLEQEKLLNQ